MLKAAEAGIATMPDGGLAHQQLAQMRDFSTFS